MGSFTIENIGAVESLLNWEIAEYPNWGTWTFTPKTGQNLKPEDGTCTIEVEIIAPDDKNTDFSGKIKIINKNSKSDYATISVSLSTPKNKTEYQLPLFVRFLDNHPHLFPLLRQLLGPQ